MRLKSINAFVLSLLVSPFYVCADLNMDFLHGGVQLQAAGVFDENTNYPAGHYIVEVIFNRKLISKKELIISPEDNENLCLKKDWINELSLPIKLNLFELYYHPERDCYDISRYPGAQVIFDNSKQTLTFSIPQIALDESLRRQEWDYGITGIKLNYSGYISKTSSSQAQIYGDFDLYANLGRWVAYVSGSINEKINYSINTSKDRDNWSNSAYFGIDHSIINTGYAISQNGHQTTSSINASGSLLATPDTGLLFSNVRRDTVAIAKIKNIEGITFNDSPPTDKEGNTIVGVSPYIENNLKINTEEIPNNVELLDSVQNFTPVDKAIIYREFKYSTIQRYILRIKNKNGDFISAGSAVRNKNDEYIGFVSNSGVLLLNLLDKPNKLFVISPNGEKCTLNLEKVESNDHKIMEIECNE